MERNPNDEILNALPESLDLNELPELLLANKSLVSDYLRTETEQILTRFSNEQKSMDSHDPTKFITLQFSNEGVKSASVPGYGDKLAINPKEVVKSLKKVFSIMQEGWGLDPGMDGRNREALEFSKYGYAKYLTLDVTADGEVLPAFRYDLSGEYPDNNAIERIVKAIKKGRQKTSFSPPGGVIKA